MNRRDMIVGTLSATGGIFVGKSLPKTTTPKCPCVDPDDDPKNPLQKNHIEICAFHINKNKVIETTHYCTKVNDDLFQCLLYESNKPDARVIGIEYVISDKLYKDLPAKEKKYWHPHNFEVKEGLLQTIGLPADCEKKIISALANSYGKSIHCWVDLSQSLPYGDPVIFWSAEKEGEIKSEMVKDRDQRYSTDSAEKKKERLEYLK